MIRLKTAEERIRDGGEINPHFEWIYGMFFDDYTVIPGYVNFQYKDDYYSTPIENVIFK